MLYRTLLPRKVVPFIYKKSDSHAQLVNFIKVETGQAHQEYRFGRKIKSLCTGLFKNESLPVDVKWKNFCVTGQVLLREPRILCK
jgi:hypothetical protein